MSVTEQHSPEEFLEQLEGLEEISFKIVYMSVALNLVSKEDAYNYLKRIHEEVNFEERVLANHMDVDNINEKLGDQGVGNYRHNQSLSEADIEEYENMEFTHPYILEMKEASNDLGYIKDAIRNCPKIIQELEQKLAELSGYYHDINKKFSIKGLEASLKPEKIQLDIKGGSSQLIEDLKDQERDELAYLVKMWEVQKELITRLVSIIDKMDSNSNELNRLIENAAENGVHVEDIRKFRKLTEEKKSDFEEVQRLAESIEDSIREDRQE